MGANGKEAEQVSKKDVKDFLHIFKVELIKHLSQELRLSHSVAEHVVVKFWDKMEAME